MYKMNIGIIQPGTQQLHQAIRKTNKRVSFSTGVISTTSVSRPQLKSNQLEDRVLHNNSQVMKKKVEDHRINFRTTKPIAMPISTREPKRTVNQFVATPFMKIVASESTIQKPRSTFRKLYKDVSKTCSWWYSKITPPGYKWKPKSKTGNVIPNINVPLGTESRTTNISEPKTVRGSILSNTPLSSNSFATRTVRFGNDQFAPYLRNGDLVQGNVTIKRVYYVEGLNHNLFSVSQFCDADLEVVFWKSTCYVHDLKGNDLLTGSRGSDLYSVTL
ncbi:hypothetical protein Tco_0791015 [Tanacetum coccineum]